MCTVGCLLWVLILLLKLGVLALGKYAYLFSSLEHSTDACPVLDLLSSEKCASFGVGESSTWILGRWVLRFFPHFSPPPGTFHGPLSEVRTRDGFVPTYSGLGGDDGATTGGAGKGVGVVGSGVHLESTSNPLPLHFLCRKPDWPLISTATGIAWCQAWAAWASGTPLPA